MKRFAGVLAALVVALGVAVPVGLSDDGGEGGRPTKAPTVTCARTVFAAAILRVGDDAMKVRAGDSETARSIVVRLDDETVVKKGDTVADRSALVVGKRARFLVRVCRSDNRRVITARVITLAADRPTVTPPSTQTEPGQTPVVCGQGEMNTMLVSVSSTSVTVRTTSSEGTKEWPLAITGDTVVRKNDQNVSIADLKAGDLVHVVLVRCPSGSVRALRIVFLPPVKVTPPPPPAETCTTAEGNVVVVSTGSSSIMVRTGDSAAGGTPVTVNGDTVVRKNDQNVSLSDLAAGDLVHVVIIRCSSGSVRAVRIVFLQSATPTT